MSCSVILTIFNKEKILKDILDGLFKTTSSNVIEYIFVLDGCTDNSEKILYEMIDKVPHGAKHKILYANNVFEIRANNIGLRNCTTDYAILVQDDMLILEQDWDLRLMKPVLTFNDIWAVTARTSCSLDKTGNWYNLKEASIGHNYGKVNILDRNKCYVGQVVNMGPLLVRMNMFKYEGFFDESLPGVIGCDDVDMCLRMYKKYKLRCCMYWIDYMSPLEWGATRNGPNSSYCSSQETLNRNECIKRYSDIITTWSFDEIREIL
jgi:glycosyltransferase involved in cell wall biosynthesis